MLIAKGQAAGCGWRRIVLLAVALLMALALPGRCAPPEQGKEAAAAPEKELPMLAPALAPIPKTKAGPGLGHKLLLYIPNRLLDTLDIVRLRLRLGPGVAVGLRATTLDDLYLGYYISVYAGLPGPRMRKMPRLPVGLESYNGIKVSLAQLTAAGGMGPDYSPSEFGCSLHPLLLGLDAGLDPYEMLDLLAGFVLLDPRGDTFEPQR